MKTCPACSAQNAADARFCSSCGGGDDAYALGEDETAADAFSKAARLVNGFVGTLAPERGAAVLEAEPVSHILSRSGRGAVT